MLTNLGQIENYIITLKYIANCNSYNLHGIQF